MTSPRVAGIDFTSRPTRRKPITVALGDVAAGVVRLEHLHEHASFEGFEAWLREPGDWVGAFDFPFGLPRAFVEANALGDSCDAVIGRVHTLCADRLRWRHLIDSWGNAQPRGHRLLHRRTDGAMPGVTSSSPLQTRYVPVGWMYFEGMKRLVAADVMIPGLRNGPGGRVALEGYPGLLAHELIGRRSYKNKDLPDRRDARRAMLDALTLAGPKRLGLRLSITHAQREALEGDTAGDRIDAVLCLVQAAWATTQPGFGLPSDIDPVEGWIVTAPHLGLIA